MRTRQDAECLSCCRCGVCTAGGPESSREGRAFPSRATGRRLNCVIHCVSRVIHSRREASATRSAVSHRSGLHRSPGLGLGRLGTCPRRMPPMRPRNAAAGSVRSPAGQVHGRRPLCAPPPSAPWPSPTLPSSSQPPCGSTPLPLPPSRCPLSYPCSLPTPGSCPVPCPCSLASVWSWLQPVLGVGPG